MMCINQAMRGGWLLLCLRLSRGEECKISEWTRILPTLVSYLISSFVIAIAIAFLTCCLVIPGIVFWVHSAFAPFLLVEENLGPFEAAKRSRELVRGYFWQVFFCQLLFLLTDIVGNNIPSVGTTCPIAFSSFYDLFMARVYIYRKSLLTND